MAASKQKAEARQDHVVVAIKRNGLWQSVSIFGPFTKAKAHVFASHHRQYEGDECSVEELETPCVQNQWIFEGVA